MMIKRISIFNTFVKVSVVIFVGTCTSAFGQDVKVLFFDKEHKIQLSMTKFKDVYIYKSKNCMNRECEVQSKINNRLKYKHQSISYDGSGHPASFLCESILNGEAETLYDQENDEYAVCKFSDGSRALSWDLFRAFYENY